jgi:hypothetical protein
MYSLVFQGQLFSVLMVPLITQCSLFETTPALLAKPYDVQSRVSLDSFRTFVSAIGGTEPNITDDNANDLLLLSDEFNFTTLSTAVAAWRAAHPSPDSDTRQILASLNEQFRSQVRVLSELGEKVDRLHQAALEGERANVTEAAESIQGEKKDIDAARAGAAAVQHEMSALVGEIGGLREAIAASGATLKEDLAGVDRQAKDSQWRSRAREAPLPGLNQENGRPVWAAAEMRRANEQLRVEVAGLKQRVEVLEHNNRRLLEAREEMKGYIAAAVGEGSAKVIENLTNLERELAKLKEEPKPINMRKKFPPSMNKKQHWDVPNGILAHLTRECRWNVRDCQVVEVTCGPFEKEIDGDDPTHAAKNAADLETDSQFPSTFRPKEKCTVSTQRLWVCFRFKEGRIVGNQYTIHTSSPCSHELRLES